MNKLTAIFLFFALTLFSFSKMSIMVNYELNKELITELFCVNKDKPDLDCNGQCHLKKQLAADEEHKETPANQSREDVSWFNYITTFFQLTELNETEVITTPPFCQLKDYSAYLEGIFRPPIS